MSIPITRRIPLRSAPNLRDLGGLRAAGGVLRSGAVYRSATLARLEGDDVEAFLGLGITTVYDLRTVGERGASPDRLPDGVRLVGLDVLADSTTDVAAGVGQLASDPAGLAATLGDGRGVELMRDSYRNIVSLPSALAAYRAFYLDLIDPARRGWGAVPLHDGQRSHGVGGGFAASAARRQRGRRACRLSRDQHRLAARSAAASRGRRGEGGGHEIAPSRPRRAG